MTSATYDTLVSTDALSRMLGDPALVIFDCRAGGESGAGRRRYLESHIPGANHADLDTDMSSTVTPASGRHPLPPVDLLAEKLRRRGVSNHSQVVVHDDMAGAIAGRMWWLLRYLGHKHVALLDGGFGKWLDEGKPLVSGNPVAVAPGNFSPRIQASMQIDTPALERILKDENTVVIDARSPERYRGEKEPVDSEGGHIPGSVNHYFPNNLDEHNCFRPVEELQGIYGPLCKPRTIHSCGSGVTACHNFLAMEIAGLPGGQLYVGSWSEWIRSRERPREIGSGANKLD